MTAPVGYPRSFIGPDGLVHTYCTSRYNASRTNERAVEIPLALSWIAGQTSDRGLEVGNVLRHYNPAARWPVVDAYEDGPDLIALDVLDYQPADPFDWIVSLSTVEHIGWDYGERDETRALAAIEHMRGMLSSTGRMLVSFPTGHHPGLDAAVAAGELAVESSTFLLRVDQPASRAPGTWQVRPFEAARYRSEIRSAGGVWIGVLGP